MKGQPQSAGGGLLGTRASPRVMFLCGALLFPAFLMQQDMVVRGVEILLFMALNAMSGRRIRPLNYLFVIAGIVIFNLIIPTGRVLVTVLGLSITEGGLKSGLLKGTAMTGLIALSQFSIRADLRLPGRFGGLIGRSLFYFEKIMSERRRIDRTDIIGSIDALLVEVQASGARRKTPAKRQARSSVGGVAVLAAIVALAWGAYILTVIHPRPFWG